MCVSCVRCHLVYMCVCSSVGVKLLDGSLEGRNVLYIVWEVKIINFR